MVVGGRERQALPPGGKGFGRFPALGRQSQRTPRAGPPRSDFSSQGPPTIFRKFLSKQVALVPSLMILNYLQAHHLDLDFYDQKLRPGSYLETHAKHMEIWH